MENNNTESGTEEKEITFNIDDLEFNKENIFKIGVYIKELNVFMEDLKQKLNDEEYELKNELPILVEIKEDNKILLNYKKEKKQLLTKILTQLYKGTLIKDELSVRKEGIFRYRCQWKLGLKNIKKTIMANLNEVTEKIQNEEKLKVLEYVLSCIEENDDERRGYYYDTDEEENTPSNTKTIDIDEVTFPMIRSFDFEVVTINKISVDSCGNVCFYKLNGDEKNLNSLSQQLILKKFSDKIEKEIKEFKGEMKDEIELREDELKEIVQVGGTQLMLNELGKGI